MQDITQHIHNISQAEIMIWSAKCDVIAVRNGEGSRRHDQMVLPCFTEDALKQRCFDFLGVVIQATLDNGSFNGTCPFGLQATTRKCTMNEKNYFFLLDRYKSTTSNSFNTVICTKASNDWTAGAIDKLTPSPEWHQAVPELTEDRVAELLDIAEQCLIEVMTGSK